jgi:hypothetical protein
MQSEPHILLVKSIADIEFIETQSNKSNFIFNSFDLRFETLNDTTDSNPYNYVQIYAPACYLDLVGL